MVAAVASGHGVYQMTPEGDITSDIVRLCTTHHDIEPVTRPNIEEIPVVSAVREPRTLMEQLIRKRWTWSQATAQFNMLAKQLTAAERGGYAPAALSERHFQRLAAGQVPTPYAWTAAVLERLFDRTLAELLGPPEGAADQAGCDDPPCQTVPPCSTGDAQEGHWSRPSTVPDTQADQRICKPGTPLREEVYDVDRRAFGGLLGGVAIGGVLVGAEAVQTRRGFSETLAFPASAVDAEEWEWTVHGYAQAAARAHARSELLPRLISDLDEVKSLIPRARSESLRVRLAEVGAELSGLAALSLASAGCWADAAAFWRTAQSAAGDNDHLSCVLGGRRAIMNLYSPNSSVETLRIADSVIARADGNPSSGAANALAARAQVLALEGDRSGAQRALSDLARVFEGLDDDVRSAYHSVWGWPEHKLHNALSFVHSHTGNVRDASEAQDAAFSMLTLARSEARSQLECHQAVCMIVSGDPVQGARRAGEVFESLDPTLRNGHLRTSISFALDKLPERARKLPAAREVRALISSTV